VERRHACALVEAFRRGERSPREELAATYAAIDNSDLNAFSHLHREQAEAAAAAADLSKPLGGVPIGVKELDQVEGWPDTHACVVYRDAVAPHTNTNPGRARDLGGAVLMGQTTASEFGGVNVTRTVLNGTTHNHARHGR
jgi:aspartyl-tRNA(Asn)/glutamyl-tRNA(Gln) amidotransferase subunit A